MNITVNNVELYYEVVGSGAPLVMIHGNGESHEVHHPQFLFAAGYRIGQQHREKRRNGRDDADIGRRRMGQGDIFQQVIEGDSRKSRACKGQFLTQSGAADGLRAGDGQGDQPHHEPEDQNLHRCKISQQYLRTDKGRTPQQDGEDRRCVTQTLFLFITSRGHSVIVKAPCSAKSAPCKRALPTII